MYMYMYIYIYIYSTYREFTKGDFVKGGLAIYACPLCNCNAFGSLFNVEIENMPNC